MPLDHTSWNDGLYYHSQAPWATNADVRTGINCVLILSRIQEEFELLAQELARGVGWAIDLYNSLSNCIGEIQSGALSGIRRSFFSAKTNQTCVLTTSKNEF
jgi:hypothetical protein